MRQFWRARGADGSPSASRNVASVPRRFMILGEVDLSLSLITMTPGARIKVSFKYLFVNKAKPTEYSFAASTCPRLGLPTMSISRA